MYIYIYINLERNPSGKGFPKSQGVFCMKCWLVTLSQTKEVKTKNNAKRNKPRTTKHTKGIRLQKKNTSRLYKSPRKGSLGLMPIWAS